MKNSMVILHGYEEFRKFLAEQLQHHNISPYVVSFDGRSGTGKSTIAKKFEEDFDCVNITMDNYYTGGTDEYWDSLTPEKRMDTVIDWQRMKKEVLLPLLNNQPGSLQSFNWELGHGLSPDIKVITPKKLILLDGAYSSRPELLDLINLSVLVEVPADDHRRQRLIGREGEKYMTNWHQRWDPSEDYYFTKLRPRESFDCILVNN